MHVAIIGAGATGTELAAELHRTAREIIAYGMDRINPDTDLKIVLIEAADRILPALPPRISASTEELLHKIGVDVRTRARVAEVMEDGVRLSDGSVIPSELVVWSAGVKAPDFLHEIGGLETNRINQIVVRPSLQSTRDDAIFAIGDCADAPRGTEGAPRAAPRPGGPTSRRASWSSRFARCWRRNRWAITSIGILARSCRWENTARWAI